jgi:hypothetical protein
MLGVTPLLLRRLRNTHVNRSLEYAGRVMLIDVLRVEHEFHIDATSAEDFWRKVYSSSDAALSDLTALGIEIPPDLKWVLDHGSRMQGSLLGRRFDFDAKVADLRRLEFEHTRIEDMKSIERAMDREKRTEAELKALNNEINRRIRRNESEGKPEGPIEDLALAGLNERACALRHQLVKDQARTEKAIEASRRVQK